MGKKGAVISLARATPVWKNRGLVTAQFSKVVVNNINLTKLTTRTPHAIAAINYCLHHLYTWVSYATAALPTMSANCIPSELVVCRAVTRPLFFHTGVARARLGSDLVPQKFGIKIMIGEPVSELE